ncbi:MAG TPA: discoidin domain-containing protein [Pyrinomonadaceae bacterium]|nr:discoidin domain-containing protein [Pyrinomonadaceae bacterium]
MKVGKALPAGLLLLAAALLVWPAAARARAGASVQLAGVWRFALDPSDAGVRERWFGRDLPETIKLPGVLQAQGYGDEISTRTPWVLSLYDRFWFLREEYKAYTRPGAVKVPFLSQPPRHYVGVAWYQRDIEVPRDWGGRRVVLFMERPRWESTVWVDDRAVGSNRSLVAPHEFDLGQLEPGRHRLTVRVDSSMLLPYRPDAHSVSDSLGGSWNGIVGRIELNSTGRVWIDDARVFPNVSKRAALLKVRVGNATERAGRGTLSAGGVSVPVEWDEKGGAAQLEVPLGAKAKTWDEFGPALQKLTLRLQGEGVEESRELSFGLVEFETEGSDFVVNGRKTYLRGNHHGGDFPLTGYPPTDVEYWRRVLRINKEWGINHVRFHSFCPPEAAFTAADELGVYLQPEPGMWNEISPGTPMERMLYEETERMIRAYGNHPSFVLLSASNEPKGRWKQSLPRWAEHFRQADPRILYTTGTGHTDREIPDPEEGADFLVVQRLGEKMLRGRSAWFGRDYRASLEGIKIPVLSHELGQWVAYPDYSVIDKFKGYMRPGNYEIFRDSLAAHGLSGKDRQFAWASGRYQLACYKEEIEANLRTPGMAGFQLLDLHDYVGQGTALVGLLDPFWESKGYVEAAEFRRFNSETVPLARLTKRVFTGDETLEAEVEVAHYGAAPLNNASPSWKVVDARGRVLASGRWPSRTIPVGKNTSLGRVSVDLSKLPAPRRYKLVVGLRGTAAENDWNFWLYPSEAERAAPRDVLITRSWDEAEAKLREGGKVLYVPRRADLDWTSPPLDDVPVFWNRLMGPAWGRMLGLLSDTRHPALGLFPTEANFDWQWSEIVRGARAVNLDRLPRALEPIVWAIDDWNRNYKLGLLFECRVGRGRLLASGADIETDLDARPAARQLRHSLLAYMASPRFRPAVAVRAEELRGLLFDTRVMKRLGAEAKGESLPTNPASNALDGDPNTFWLAGDARKGVKHPHALNISFPAPVAVSGLVLMPRQNHREHEGDIRGYRIEASDDGERWREVARGELVSTFEPQRLSFPQTVTARHLRLTALGGFGTDVTAALAELAVAYAGPKLPDEADDAPEYKRTRTATPDIDEGTPAAQPTPTPTRRPRSQRGRRKP